MILPGSAPPSCCNKLSKHDDVFAVEQVSNYLSLFYIAFIKGYLTTFDKYLPFEPAPCDCSSELVGDTVLCCRAELYAQLVSLVVLRQAYGNIKEVLLPWIAHKCSQRSLARQNKSQEAEACAKDNVPIKGNQVAPGDAANTGDESDNTGGNKLKHLIKEEQESAIVGPVKQSTMKRHDSCMATFDEYNEMVIQVRELASTYIDRQMEISIMSPYICVLWSSLV